MASRAEVYAALFTRLKSVPGLKTCERRLRSWDQVDPGEQPALFMALGQQMLTQQRGLPPHWTLEANVWLYARRDATEHSTDREEDPGADVLCDLIDAIGAKLSRQPDESTSGPFGASPTLEVTTLGGQVSWARMEGPVLTDEGFEGDQAVAKLTIHMSWVQDE